MCVAALFCALTYPAPVTPWERSTTCALATALKKIFSGYEDQSQRDVLSFSVSGGQSQRNGVAHLSAHQELSHYPTAELSLQA